MDLESAAASLLRQWRGNSGIVEAFAEHEIPAFRGSSEWFAEGKPQHFLYTLCRTNFNKLLHLKSRMMRRE